MAAQAHLPFIVLQPLGFILFFTSAVAEVARIPFDLPEAENGAGLRLQHRVHRHALRHASHGRVHQHDHGLGIDGLLYLGGWNGPAFLPPVAWFPVKLAVMLFVFIWMRASLPRLRYDRLMSLGWKVLLPLAFLNLLVTAVVVAMRSSMRHDSRSCKGMFTTFKMFFRRRSTIAYPERKKPRRSARFRGLHELRRYDNGLEMCIGCELCQVACPANAITVIAAENDPAAPHSPGERYAATTRSTCCAAFSAASVRRLAPPKRCI